MIALLASLLISRPLLMAHYMPWYQSKPFSGSWGWHWTMNHFDPDRGQLASRFHPLIGPYDSDDPAALECQCLLMKLSGIDGVLIDWYGTRDLYDYRQNQRNSIRMVRALTKAGLKFAVVFEDSTAGNLIQQGRMQPSQALDYGRECLQWLDAHWFGLPNYATYGGRPVFLVFGGQLFFNGSQWAAMFSGLRHRPAFFTELGVRDGSTGGFGWPEPQQGPKSWQQLAGFYDRAKSWPASIAVAYPRFEDIYAQAGVHASWGEIEDANGETYRRSLEMAFASRSPIVQIATWNDWGEGTQIEPSKEFGFRDLETTQRERRSRDPHFDYGEGDLRLPVRLYLLRKRFAGHAERQRKLDDVYRMILDGQTKQASRAMAAIE